MATYKLDPDALRARLKELQAEVTRIERVLEVLPDLELVGTNGHHANGKRGLVPNPGTRPAVPGLRPINSQLLGALRNFVASHAGSEFTVPDVLAFVRKQLGGYEKERDRDQITAGLRHLIADNTISVKTPGFGRRLQVYAKTGKA